MLLSYGIGKIGEQLRRWRRPFSTPIVGPIGDVPRPLPWLDSYPKNVDWNVHITPQSMTKIWDEALAAYAERPCLEFLGPLV